MNIRVRPGLSVFARHLRPGEPDFGAASEWAIGSGGPPAERGRR